MSIRLGKGLVHGGLMGAGLLMAISLILPQPQGLPDPAKPVVASGPLRLDPVPPVPVAATPAAPKPAPAAPAIEVPAGSEFARAADTAPLIPQPLEPRISNKPRSTGLSPASGAESAPQPAKIAGERPRMIDVPQSPLRSDPEPDSLDVTTESARALPNFPAPPSQAISSLPDREPVPDETVAAMVDIPETQPIMPAPQNEPDRVMAPPALSMPDPVRESVPLPPEDGNEAVSLPEPTVMGNPPPDLSIPPGITQIPGL